MGVRSSYPTSAVWMYDRSYALTEGDNQGVWLSAAAPLLVDVIEYFDLGGRRVLELGCGEAKNGLAAARAGAEVCAVDYSLVALNKGRRQLAEERDPRHGQIHWLRGDLLQMPFKNTVPGQQPFDVVILQGILDCCETTEQAQAMTTFILRHLLAPDGLLVVSSFHDRLQTNLEVAHDDVNHWIPSWRDLLKMFRVNEPDLVTSINTGTIEDVACQP